MYTEERVISAEAAAIFLSIPVSAIEIAWILWADVVLPPLLPIIADEANEIKIKLLESRRRKMTSYFVHRYYSIYPWAKNQEIIPER